MHHTLADQLLAAVRDQDFAATPDAWRGGAPLTAAAFPSIDLAVIDFAAPGGPRWANVLFSREHPVGLAAEMSGTAGAVHNVRFDADQRDAQLHSTPWLPGADWSQLHWTSLDAAAAERPHRAVAPYPASLLKLMVAVGVGMAVDRGLCGWPAALEPMLVLSDNDATDSAVALLHRLQMVAPLNQSLADLGLRTLQLHNTTAQGGWRNADGAGVGQIHMTAWDTARLLWLLDTDAPPPPWLPAGGVLLQPATRDHLRAVLQRQQLDHVLSSGSLQGLPGWVAGLPDAPVFAHKTGSTDNYASDAGIVRSAGAHYIVALLSSLGRRHAAVADDPLCVTTWRVQALGAAIHALLTQP